MEVRSNIGKFALGQNPLLDSEGYEKEDDRIRLHDLCFIFAHSDIGYIKQFTQLPANQLHLCSNYDQPNCDEQHHRFSSSSL